MVISNLTWLIIFSFMYVIALSFLYFSKTRLDNGENKIWFHIFFIIWFFIFGCVCKIRMDNLKDKIIDYKTYRFNIIFFQNQKIIFQNHIQIWL